MKKFLQNLSEIIVGSEKHSRRNREFVVIGGQVFAVAHSREEMVRMLRAPDRKVNGYVLQHRM